MPGRCSYQCSAANICEIEEAHAVAAKAAEEHAGETKGVLGKDEYTGVAAIFEPERTRKAIQAWLMESHDRRNTS